MDRCCDHATKDAVIGLCLYACGSVIDHPFRVGMINSGPGDGQFWNHFVLTLGLCTKFSWIIVVSPKRCSVELGTNLKSDEKIIVGERPVMRLGE